MKNATRGRRAITCSQVETLVALLLASRHGRFCFTVAVLQRARDVLRRVAHRFSTDVSVPYDVERAPALA